MACVQPAATSIGPEISPVKAPSLAHAMFCAPMRMFDPCAAPTAAVRFVKGGQITVSQWSAPPASGRNASKNAMVSAGVLYIFQLPAMTGFLIRSVSKRDLRQEAFAVFDGHSEIGGHGLPDIGERAAQPQVHAAARARTGGQQGNVFARVVGTGDGGVA